MGRIKRERFTVWPLAPAACAVSKPAHHNTMLPSRNAFSPLSPSNSGETCTPRTQDQGFKDRFGCCRVAAFLEHSALPSPLATWLRELGQSAPQRKLRSRGAPGGSGAEDAGLCRDEGSRKLFSLWTQAYASAEHRGFDLNPPCGTLTRKISKNRWDLTLSGTAVGF